MAALACTTMHENTCQLILEIILREYLFVLLLLVGPQLISVFVFFRLFADALFFDCKKKLMESFSLKKE